MQKTSHPGVSLPGKSRFPSLRSIASPALPATLPCRTDASCTFAPLRRRTPRRLRSGRHPRHGMDRHAGISRYRSTPHIQNSRKKPIRPVSRCSVLRRCARKRLFPREGAWQVFWLVPAAGPSQAQGPVASANCGSLRDLQQRELLPIFTAFPFDHAGPAALCEPCGGKVIK